MNRADIHDGGFRARSAHASYAAGTAGAGTDNVETSGPYVAREDATSGIAKSAKLIIGYRAVLAEGATLSIGANIQDDADGTGASVADYGDAYASAVVATGGSGGSTETGTIELDFDLGSADAYVRSQITADASAANTDTFVVWATWVFFGAPLAPMTKTVI